MGRIPAILPFLSACGRSGGARWLPPGSCGVVRESRRGRWRATPTVIMMLGVACSHSPTTGTVPYTPDDAPLTATAPVRLTYDPGIDAFASFSPDGATMLYAFQPRDRDDHDRCIGFMPAGGGSREEHCDNTGIGAARTDALEYPALNSRGELLYARYASAIGDFIPNTAEVSLQLATFSVGRDTIFFTRSRDNRLYAVATDGTVGSVVYSAPQSPGRPREFRSPARVESRVVTVLQDIDTSEPPLYPAGLAPGASIQLIETRSGTAATLQEASVAVPSFGRVTTVPGSCRIVVEFTHRQSVSFTTDLYSLCPTGDIPCTCS